ncbi:MAG TPA: HAD family phosphatase [Kiritimatiellae bacterium]|nr:HAD family phosphatase [Kiritimatiellia bacterium]
MQPVLEAVILDFDGVLFDTERLHWQAFARVLSPLGIELGWREYCAGLIGLDDRGVFAQVLGRKGAGSLRLEDLVGRKERVFGELAASAPLGPLPGADELVEECAARDIPLGICSGASRQDIMRFLSRWDKADRFRVVVSADDVAKSKPHPESYLTALEMLARDAGRSIRPYRAVAIEDTAAGTRAARRAGLRVILLRGGCRPAEGDEPACDLSVASLRQVNCTMLGRLISAG